MAAQRGQQGRHGAAQFLGLGAQGDDLLFEGADLPGVTVRRAQRRRQQRRQGGEPALGHHHQRRRHAVAGPPGRKRIHAARGGRDQADHRGGGVVQRGKGFVGGGPAQAQRHAIGGEFGAAQARAGLVQRHRVGQPAVGDDQRPPVEQRSEVAARCADLQKRGHGAVAPARDA